MACRDIAKRRQRDLARYRRRTEARRAAGLCLKCGKTESEPERTLCAPCAEKRSAGDRARNARLRAEGKPRRDPERAKCYERERGRRLHIERKAVGLCTGCGRAPARPGRTTCEPCAEKHRARDRARHARAKARGLAYGGRDPEAKRRADRKRSRLRADRRDAFETMRDAAAEQYRSETGDTWRPGRGSHTSQTGKLTSAAIDARDYLRAQSTRGGARAPGVRSPIAASSSTTPSPSGGISTADQAQRTAQYGCWVVTAVPVEHERGLPGTARRGVVPRAGGHDQGRKRERYFQSLHKIFPDRTKSLIKFYKPANVRGTGLLSENLDGEDETRQLDLPARLRSVKQLSVDDRHKSFMGSDFTNADISGRTVGQDEHEVLEDAGKIVTVRSVPKDGRDPYAYLETQVMMEILVPRQVTFFDREDRKIRTLKNQEIRKYCIRFDPHQQPVVGQFELGIMQRSAEARSAHLRACVDRERQGRRPALPA